MTNRELVLAFYDEVFNALNADAAAKFVKEDYIQHNPTVKNGREGFIETFRNDFKKGFPYLEVQHIICEDNMICVHLHGLDRENRRPICWVADIYRVEDGLFAEHWDCIQAL